MDGRGLSQWGTDATARANAHRGKVRASKAVIDRLKAKGLISPTLEKGLAPRTNLDRVLQMPYMAQALGIRIAKDGDISYENDDAAKGDKLLLKRSEEHTSELQSLMRISYAVFCLKKKKNTE